MGYTWKLAQLQFRTNSAASRLPMAFPVRFALRLGRMLPFPPSVWPLIACAFARSWARSLGEEAIMLMTARCRALMNCPAMPSALCTVHTCCVPLQVCLPSSCQRHEPGLPQADGQTFAMLRRRTVCADRLDRQVLCCPWAPAAVQVS